MTDHGDYLRIERQLPRCSDCLLRLTAIIQRHQLNPLASEAATRVDLADRQTRGVDGFVTDGTIAAFERRDEAELDDGLCGSSTSGEANYCK
jgi:hypothetical protein